MERSEYGQNLVDMQHQIHELNRYLFQTKVRKKKSNAFPEKIKICPVLKMLKDIKDMYNADEEKYSFTIGIPDNGLEDILLEDYTTFESIIKKLDDDESGVSLEVINTAQTINNSWLNLIKEQEKLYKTFFKD